MRRFPFGQIQGWGCSSGFPHSLFELELTNTKRLRLDKTEIRLCVDKTEIRLCVDKTEIRLATVSRHASRSHYQHHFRGRLNVTSRPLLLETLTVCALETVYLICAECFLLWNARKCFHFPCFRENNTVSCVISELFYLSINIHIHLRSWKMSRLPLGMNSIIPLNMI